MQVADIRLDMHLLVRSQPYIGVTSNFGGPSDYYSKFRKKKKLFPYLPFVLSEFLPAFWAFQGITHGLRKWYCKIHFLSCTSNIYGYLK